MLKQQLYYALLVPLKGPTNLYVIIVRNFDPVGSVNGSTAVKSVKLACNGRKILTSGADR